MQQEELMLVLCFHIKLTCPLFHYSNKSLPWLHIQFLVQDLSPENGMHQC